MAAAKDVDVDIELSSLENPVSTSSATSGVEEVSNCASSSVELDSSSEEHDPPVTVFEENPDGYSSVSAIVNLVKGCVGGLLVYLPFAAGNCGILLALIILVLLAFAIASSSALVTRLILMSRSLAHRLLTKETVETFEDMSKVAWGKWGYYVVAIVVYVDLILAAAVMMGTLAFTVDDVIVACTGENMIRDANGNKTDEIDWFYESSYARFVGLVGACMVVIFPLCLFKDMNAISKLSFLGTLANIILLACIIASACQTNPKFEENVNQMGIYSNNSTINTNQRYVRMWDFDTDTQKYVVQRRMFDFENMWSFFGACGMCFSISAIAPWIALAMRKPGGFKAASWVSYPVIALIYGLVIVVCFVAWGNGVCRPQLDFSQPEGHQLLIINLSVIHSLFMPQLWVQIVAAVSLFVSLATVIPLVFFVVASWWEGLLKKYCDCFKDMTHGKEIAFRVLNRAVLFLFMCCFNLLGAKHLPDLQGFCGAITTTAISAILPNVLFLSLLYKFTKGHPFRVAGLGILTMSVFALFMGIASLVIGFMFNGLMLFGVDLQNDLFWN